MCEFVEKIERVKFSSYIFRTPDSQVYDLDGNMMGEKLPISCSYLDTRCIPYLNKTLNKLKDEQYILCVGYIRPGEEEELEHIQFGISETSNCDENAEDSARRCFVEEIGICPKKVLFNGREGKYAFTSCHVTRMNICALPNDLKGVPLPKKKYTHCIPFGNRHELQEILRDRYLGEVTESHFKTTCDLESINAEKKILRPYLMKVSTARQILLLLSRLS